MPNKTETLYLHAKQRIPGGTQLLSKRPEMMAPGLWPAYYRKAFGCEVIDLDGRHYYDMSTCGIGSCLLGFADPEVTEAVIKAVKDGSMSSLNCYEEVELADKLCQIHTWASQARFARTGGESMAIAVRIARSTTDKNEVAICGYHGWTDWYIAANLGDSNNLRNMLLPGLDAYGVPEQLRGTTHTFSYGDQTSFLELIKNHGNKLAAVVMEPMRHHAPPAGFMELIRSECNKHGIILIFDEITIGWRYCLGGSHLNFGVNPDIAVFAKALGNGHPIGAVIGTAEAMSGVSRSFISSTYWTERVGPVAALATIAKMEQSNAAKYVNNFGAKMMAAWTGLGTKHQVKLHATSEVGCLASFAFDYPNANAIRTLYTQLMLEQGFLAGCAIYPTLAHNDEILNKFTGTADAVFAQLAKAIAQDQVESSLRGPVAHTTFQRLIK
ncbi:MAG: aminotransferase class III-fold pyridoxal phosphate-dependent enzyme [Victivallaceae bacterium]|jgi:glutamate-1-semialdehyde 2,1-aminomutase